MKIKKRYLMLFMIAVLLAPVAAEHAYEMRQAFHVGGEWLLIVLFPLLGVLGDSVKGLWNDFKRSFEHDATID